MADKLKLKLEPRKTLGRKVKALRREGQLPGNIYGKGIKSLSVQASLKEFSSVFSKAGETSIIELNVVKETKARPALIHQVMVDPVSGQFLHADFHQVDLSQAVKVEVPIELVGEAPAVQQGGVLVQLLNEVEVEALPADLPDKFTVDVSKLTEMNQGITLKELRVGDKVKLMVESLDELVVKIDQPTKEVVEEVAAVTEEVPAEGEAAPAAEGETPAPAEGKEVKEGEKKEAPQPKAGEVKADKKAEAK